MEGLRNAATAKLLGFPAWGWALGIVVAAVAYMYFTKTGFFSGSGSAGGLAGNIGAGFGQNAGGGFGGGGGPLGTAPVAAGAATPGNTSGGVASIIRSVTPAQTGSSGGGGSLPAGYGNPFPAGLNALGSGAGTGGYNSVNPIQLAGASLGGIQFPKGIVSGPLSQPAPTPAYYGQQVAKGTRAGSF